MSTTLALWISSAIVLAGLVQTALVARGTRAVVWRSKDATQRYGFFVLCLFIAGSNAAAVWGASGAELVTLTDRACYGIAWLLYLGTMLLALPYVLIALAITWRNYPVRDRTLRSLT